MRILPISQKITSELRKVESARKVDRAEKTGKVAKTDRSELSSKAQRLSEAQASVETIAPHVTGQPDIRADRVAEVRQRIEEGYYNGSEFVDKLAEKLMSDFGLTGLQQ